MPPIGDLTPYQERALNEALLSAFDLAGLKQMFRLRMGIRLDYEVNVNAPFRSVVSDAVAWAVQTGSVETLVRSALHERPGNSKLQEVAYDLGVTKLPPVDVAGRDTAALERLVNARSRLLDFTAFAGGIDRIGRQICRVEIPDGAAEGTGWLVGPDLVLTAYHVIEKADRGPYDGGDVVCRFDYTADGTDGRSCGLADAWLLDWSPYGDADLGTPGAPPVSQDELDHALLRLAAPVGEDDVSGAERGWVVVPERPPLVDTDDFMLVPQHPGGDTLKVAFGRVLGADPSGFRLRYDASTQKGSSGAPCFDLDLRPFGLHHASGPHDDQPFNQCVPLRHIVRRVQRLREAGEDVPAFWAPADA